MLAFLSLLEEVQGNFRQESGLKKEGFSDPVEEPHAVSDIRRFNGS